MISPAANPSASFSEPDFPAPGASLEDLCRVLGGQLRIPAEIQGKAQSDPRIQGVEQDSRHVKAGDLFVALQANSALSEGYLHQAIQAGAVAVLTSTDGNSVLADAVEALLGALYLDEGFEPVRPVTRQIIAPRLDRLVAEGGMVRDPKSRLQELLQARGLPAPSYRIVAATGPAHDRAFTVALELDLPDGEDPFPGIDLQACQGTGRSRKIAEKATARMILDRLEASA